ncbi:MAG: amino acid adenylation domain-containing protein [Eubacterium sp.]|nr:amino acid adenylation domain-containing protein [Eubacterium sp.]
MIFNVLQYLENSAKQFPDKIALEDEFQSVTYEEYVGNAKKIGTYVTKKVGGITGKAVAVLIDRNVKSICSFMGIVYSGNFYVPIDATMPKERIDLIYQTLDPICTIDARNKEKESDSDSTVTYTDILENGNIDEDVLQNIRNNHIDTDPLYAIFTSGSTGVPKGVLISHRSVIDLVNSFDEAFGFEETNVFANQAPFDFDVSTKDIYNSMFVGATIQVVPKKMFKMPKLLVGYIQEKKIDTLIWAVSALRIVSDFKTLDETTIHLKNVMFSGEVMPVKSLNYWIDHVPEARYVNLYGPTEITCNCTYYIIDKENRLENDQMIPIGKAFRNCRVFLMDEKNQKIDDTGVTGEICVEGTCLGLGYWNNEERTSAAFVRNPMISAYESKIYRTGDMGVYNDKHEIVFASRKDYQIKHMGHRIELGEVEVALNAIPFLTIACCIYDETKERIVCHYQAEEDCKKNIVMELSKKLPKYMWPNVYVRHDEMPMNKNGKIDRVQLKKES